MGYIAILQVVAPAIMTSGADNTNLTYVPDHAIGKHAGHLPLGTVGTLFWGGVYTPFPQRLDMIPYRFFFLKDYAGRPIGQHTPGYQAGKILVYMGFISTLRYANMCIPQ